MAKRRARVELISAPPTSLTEEVVSTGSRSPNAYFRARMLSVVATDQSFAVLEFL